MIKNIRKFPFAAMILCGLTLICLGLLSGCGNDHPASGGESESTAVTVELIRPRRVTFTTELAGRISAFQVSEVRPQVNGILQKRLFEEGADVQASDILYKIDPAVYKANYDAAKAQLARAEANVLPTELKVKREQELIKEHAVSPQNFEASDAAYKQAL
ncbi:MAG: efflux transporter periplasmic adaptor subunit, partial [Candidatus Adiutrix sp.]|nr:efflux transporter periplasmic adaptor subunit [Candidatus Adiutrix sp.]